VSFRKNEEKFWNSVFTSLTKKENDWGVGAKTRSAQKKKPGCQRVAVYATEWVTNTGATGKLHCQEKPKIRGGDCTSNRED